MPEAALNPPPIDAPPGRRAPHGIGRAGTTPSPPPWSRIVRFPLLLRRADADALVALADAWGVPVATAGWAIVAEWVTEVLGHDRHREEIARALARAAHDRALGRETAGRRMPEPEPEPEEEAAP